LRPKLAYVLLVVLVALAAGCGGSSKSSTPAAETTAEATTTEETTATEETTTEETTTETETTSSDDNTPSFASSKNCLELLNLSAAFAKAAGATNGENDLDATVKFFDEIADKAPAEIRGDFKVVAKAFSAYAKALKDADFKPGQQPTPEQIEKLTKAAESFNQAEVQKASEHISAWSKKNCSS
jgi:hypothetical protein